MKGNWELEAFVSVVKGAGAPRRLCSGGGRARLEGRWASPEHRCVRGTCAGGHFELAVLCWFLTVSEPPGSVVRTRGDAGLGCPPRGVLQGAD